MKEKERGKEGCGRKVGRIRDKLRGRDKVVSKKKFKESTERINDGDEGGRSEGRKKEERKEEMGE